MAQKWAHTNITETILMDCLNMRVDRTRNLIRNAREVSGK
jgi:hypothetical protein